MRTIKFRVWNKKHSQMTYPRDGEIERDAHELLRLCVFFNSVWRSIENNKDYGDDFNNYVVMQSTGLKDRNGVEVWEGDVLKAQDGKIIEIRWDESGAFMPGFCYHEIEKGPSILLNGEVEVIGNVWENGELV